MAAYSGEDGREMLEKVSFGQKKAKIERSPSPESLIFRPQASFSTRKPHFPARKSHFFARKPYFPPAIPHYSA